MAKDERRGRSARLAALETRVGDVERPVAPEAQTPGAEMPAAMGGAGDVLREAAQMVAGADLSEELKEEAQAIVEQINALADRAEGGTPEPAGGALPPGSAEELAAGPPIV